MLNRLSLLFKVFKLERSVRRFLVWAVLGLAFSQAVIISTLGLMNGFEHAMKSTLNEYLPEITIRHRFDLPFDKDDLNAIKNSAVDAEVYLFNTLDGFLIKADESSSAVRIFEVPGSVLRKNFSFNSPVTGNGIIIGRGLANKLNLSEGDPVSFLSQSDDQQGLSFSRKTIFKIIDFSIYEQSQRLVFTVQKTGKQYNNLIGLELPNKTVDNVIRTKLELESFSDYNYSIKPFWSDYEFLLEAVEVEKKSIAFILQIIVVVAIFNVVAFLLYFKEVNNQKLFLLSAFGMSKKQRRKNWRKLTYIVWALSTLVSVCLVLLFDFALAYLPIFKLPSEIYYFERLAIRWSSLDFLIVSFFCFLILFLISNFFISKMEKSSLLGGLREEFN